MSKSTLEDHLGSKIPPNGCLSTDLLQANSAEDENTKRIPTAMVSLPSHKLLIIGFNSGELQVYKAIDGKFESGFEPGAGFRISENYPVKTLKQSENWNPFIGESSAGQSTSVFYAACRGCSEIFMFYVVGSEVKLSWVKYQLHEGKYQVSDAVICQGMSKMIGATEQGRLLVFPAEVEPHFDEDQLVDEQVETKHILIVAHEGSVTCLSTNHSGTLALTGGQDGKICIWQWGKDHFFHQVGQMYLTNLPIFAALFTNNDDNEIVLSLDTYIMCLRVIKKTSQIYVLEQFPAKHIKVAREGGKISGPSCLHALGSNKFLILRSSKLVEVVGPGAEESLYVDERPMASTCINYEVNGQLALTTIGYLTTTMEPFVNVWIKNVQDED